MRLAVVAALAGAVVAATAVSSGARAPRAADRQAPTVLAAGDIASCSSDGDEKTARLVVPLPGTVAALGDTVYETGTSAEYAECYAPSWGRFRARTRPAIGNHEYGTPRAAGYFAYFRSRAGRPGRAYYGYRLGAWHVLALDSNCSQTGGCGPGTAQYRWLERQLQTTRTRCTLAYWHHPLFSSGLHGPDRTVRPFWDLLYRYGADVVLSAHDHHYERFAPQTPAGRPDARRGIRTFVVGTGGRSHYPVVRVLRNSQVRESGTFGVLKLTLSAGRYAWRFLPVAGERFTDAGSARCH